MKRRLTQKYSQLFDILSAMSRVLVLIWKTNPRQAFVLAFFEVLQGVIPIALAYFSGHLVTDVVKAVEVRSFEPVYGSFIAVTLIGLVSIVIWPIKSLIDSQLRFAVETEVTTQLMQKYARLSVEQRESKEVADLFEKAESYTYRASWVFGWVLDLVHSLRYGSCHHFLA
jgi:ABC-type multidrug transport system fused ATPase/permease subunit